MAVKVSSVKPLKDMIARARAAGKGVEIQEAMGERLQQRMRLRFDTKLDPNGQPWEQWAESTKKQYAERDSRTGNGGRSGSLLIRSQADGMRGSLTRSVGARDVTVGFAKPYAKWHETGTRRMPRRGLIFVDPISGVLSPDDIAAMQRVGLKVLTAEIDSPTTRT